MDCNKRMLFSRVLFGLNGGSGVCVQHRVERGFVLISATVCTAILEQMVALVISRKGKSA